MNAITLDAIISILVEAGLEVEQKTESALWVRDSESGVYVTCVLQTDILFNTLSCVVLDKSAITEEIKDKMLDSQNGISTSSFQLYELENGKVAVTLNNFAKLQELGDDDKDDILSCITFLFADVIDAKDLLGLAPEEADEAEDDDDTEDDDDDTEDDDIEDVADVVEAVAEVVEAVADSGYGGDDGGGDDGGE